MARVFVVMTVPEQEFEYEVEQRELEEIAAIEDVSVEEVIELMQNNPYLYWDAILSDWHSQVDVEAEVVVE